MTTSRNAALSALTLAWVLAIPPISLADDVSVTPGGPDGGFVVTDTTGVDTQLKVDDKGVYTPGLTGPAAGDPVCSQQGGDGLLVICDAASLGAISQSNNLNCGEIASGTWFPTQTRSVTAACPPGASPTGGGCSINNNTSWTYATAIQTRDISEGDAWKCEWAVPASVFGGVTILGTTTICASVHCAK
jgi:hypothetical protein